MEFVTALGLLAGTLTTVSFVPQVLRILITRDTRAISLGMYALFSVGVLLWLLYGLLLGEIPIILTNAVVLVLAGAVLALKLRHG
jgi:MtN3 and saliva related transmembrane protein